MRHWLRCVVAVAAPLLLSSCLWGPGKFNSQLTLKKDGSFVLDYHGQIVLQMPPDATAPPFKPEDARCFEGVEQHGRGAIMEAGAQLPKNRPCTPAEVAAQKADAEKS